MNKKYWAPSIFILIILAGLVLLSCQSQNKPESKSLSVFLGKMDVHSGYEISEYYEYASSGGGHEQNTTREIGVQELKDDINALKRMKIAGSFAYGTKNCFYSGSEEPNYFVCFEDNKIVNFVKKNGPEFSYWSAAGYDFDVKKSTVINSISDLKTCNADDDCTLESAGVCDSSGECPVSSSADCDSGCRTSINAKHYLIWDFVPMIEDECITDKCANDNEYFNYSCKNHICEAVIVENQ